jgi:hypothetical protein
MRRLDDRYPRTHYAERRAVDRFQVDGGAVLCNGGDQFEMIALKMKDRSMVSKEREY